MKTFQVVKGFFEIQKRQKIPNNMNTKKFTLWNIIHVIKLSKIKEKKLESSKRKQHIAFQELSEDNLCLSLCIRQVPIKISVNFSAEICKPERKGWHIQTLTEKNCQPRILYPEKLSFKNDSEIQTPQVNKNWQELSTARFALPKLLKTILYFIWLLLLLGCFVLFWILLYLVVVELGSPYTSQACPETCELKQSSHHSFPE